MVLARGIVAINQGYVNENVKKSLFLA